MIYFTQKVEALLILNRIINGHWCKALIDQMIPRQREKSS